MSNDRFQIHLISRKSVHRDWQEPGGLNGWRQFLRYAIFYLVVAAILLVTNQSSKSPVTDAVQPQSAANLEIHLSVTRDLTPNGLAGNAGGTRAYAVRFRLTNQGNAPIFYSASPNTNRPLGHVVYRIVPESGWRRFSQPEFPALGRDELETGNIAWIEMPPGGWVDGDYVDTGSPVGEHAYEVDLRFEANGKVSPLFSKPYFTGTN